MGGVAFVGVQEVVGTVEHVIVGNLPALLELGHVPAQLGHVFQAGAGGQVRSQARDIAHDVGDAWLGAQNPALCRAQAGIHALQVGQAAAFGQHNLLHARGRQANVGDQRVPGGRLGALRRGGLQALGNVHGCHAAALHGHGLGLYFAGLQINEEVARLDAGVFFLAKHADGHPLLILQREHGEHGLHLCNVQRVHLAAGSVVQAAHGHFQLGGAAAGHGQAHKLALAGDGIADDVAAGFVAPQLRIVEVGGLQLLAVAVDDAFFHGG
ncbi:hypothetical protein D3C71_975360 [compost metagenome]